MSLLLLLTGTSTLELSESLPLSETLVKTVQRALADPLTLSEVLEAIKPPVLQGVSDTLTLSEALAAVQAKLIAEPITLMETLQKTVFINPSETLTLTEVLHRLFSHLIAETQPLVEALDLAQGMSLLITIDVIQTEATTPYEVPVTIEVLGDAIYALVITVDIEGPGVAFTSFPVTIDVLSAELDALLAAVEQRPMAILEHE